MIYPYRTATMRFATTIAFWDILISSQSNSMTQR